MAWHPLSTRSAGSTPAMRGRVAARTAAVARARLAAGRPDHLDHPVGAFGQRA